MTNDLEQMTSTELEELIANAEEAIGEGDEDEDTELFELIDDATEILESRE